MPVWRTLGGALVVSTLFAGGASGAVVVRGETKCPRVLDVETALVGLLPAGDGAGDVVEISELEGAAAVRLTSAGGKLLAERRLPAAMACGERAHAAAVVVAAWEARLRAGVGPVLDVGAPAPRVAPSPSAAPAPPATAPPTAALPAASPSPAAAPPAVAAPAAAPAPAPAPAREVAAATVVVAVAQPPAPLAVEINAAFLVSVASPAGAGAAPGALLEGRLARRDGRLGLGVAVLAVNTHTLPVAPGQGAWRRLGGVITGRSIARSGAVETDLHAGLALTALMIRGQSFPGASGDTLLDPGLVVGGRVALRVGGVDPWLGVSGIYWPRPHDVYLNGAPGSERLPAFEIVGMLGVSLAAKH